ncbi:MAG: OmpH family outer membrane protein [Phycisphaerales bacterium]|nr:OmpH family outer membrane protein [Phycisphaerales bacterium]
MFRTKSASMLLVLAGTLCFANAAKADTNIAVLNVARIFEDYAMTRDLESMFDQARRDAADEADRRRNSMDQMRRALAAFDPNSADYERRDDELTKAEVEFQIWSKTTEKKLKGDHLRWMQKIYHNTQDVIAAIAKERNIDLVLTYDELADDAPDSVALRQQILLQKVIYHSDRADITNEVLNRLNDAYKTQGGLRGMQPTSGGGPARAPATQTEGSDRP